MLEEDVSEQDMEFDAYGGSIEERELDFEIPLPDPASQIITTVVCAICKNEKPYILEWVAHQKLSGFDQIFVYDNDSDDGTSEALIRLHNAGEITRVYWPRIPDVAPQRSAYADFLERHSGNFDWALICDLDEFLCVDVGNVKDFIALAMNKCPDVAAIAVPWLVFGASGQEDIYDELVVKRFNHCETSCDGAVKPIFKPCKVFNIRTHIVDFSHGVYLDNTLRPAQWDNMAPTHLEFPKYGIARIHHYFTKSRKEWERRKSLGRADRSDIQLRNLALFDRYEHLNGRNQQLAKHSLALKDFESKHSSELGNSVSAQLVFRSDSLAIVWLAGDFQQRNGIRIVLNERHELLNPNLINMTGNKLGVSVNLTHLRAPLISMRISDISTGQHVLIEEQDFPSRKRMLRNVLDLMPDAETLKFNLFRRVSSSAAGAEYLKQIDFGEFKKFLEYRDFIALLQENNFSSISEDQIADYLGRHGRMGQACLRAFMNSNHYLSTLIPDFARTKYIVY